MEFLNKLEQKLKMVFDGAMGTELLKRGAAASNELNLINPEVVFSVHHDYARLGIDGLLTNTLTASRLYFKGHHLEADLKKINQEGVKLARAAAEKTQFVFGDIGPSGRLLKPYGEYTEEEFINNFKEQALFLAEAGVDGFIIETMTDLREALCALQGCKEVTDLPVIVTMSFARLDQGVRTIMGNSLKEVAVALKKHGACVIGSNCGDLSPLDMAALALKFRAETDLPLMFQPNAGMPVLKEGKTTFNMLPADFALGTLKCLENGAQLVGGCCGTTPEHIRALLAGLN